MINATRLTHFTLILATLCAAVLCQPAAQAAEPAARVIVLPAVTVVGRKTPVVVLPEVVVIGKRQAQDTLFAQQSRIARGTRG